jgi:hypothetical protein
VTATAAGAVGTGADDAGARGGAEVVGGGAEVVCGGAEGACVFFAGVSRVAVACGAGWLRAPVAVAEAVADAVVVIPAAVPPPGEDDDPPAFAATMIMISAMKARNPVSAL